MRADGWEWGFIRCHGLRATILNTMIGQLPSTGIDQRCAEAELMTSQRHESDTFLFRKVTADMLVHAIRCALSTAY